MTVIPTAAEQQATWKLVAQAAAVTATMAEEALAAMEASPAQYLDGYSPVAQRIAGLGDELHRPDLATRATMIMADITARDGEPLRAIADIERAAQWATQAGDNYVLARSYYLLTRVKHAIGDRQSAQRHGVLSLENLPDDAPVPIRIDHLIMYAVACGQGPDADPCNRRALDLATAIGDVSSAMRIHNNVAYTAWQVGDGDTATEHVAHMLELSDAHDVPLQASALDTVARIYIEAGRYLDAIETLKPATGDISSVPSLDGSGVLHTEAFALPECLLTIAEVHWRMGDFDLAQEKLDQARTLGIQRGLGHVQAQSFWAQASLYAAQGDFKLAYREHVAFHDATLRLYSGEQEARARIVQASFDAGEKQRDTARFRELAIRDPLTGLYNRRFIDKQLAGLTAQAAEHHSQLSAAIVDADFFKRINDELSHEVGDKVLRQLSSILESAVIPPETAGRLGGEEFVILLPSTSATQAFERCEQVRRAIEEHPWEPLTGSIPVTVSIGVATAATGQTSPSALLSDADRNLYGAKRSGRNRVMADAH